MSFKYYFIGNEERIASAVSISKSGFNIQDEFIFKILLEFINTRLSIISHKRESLMKLKEAQSVNSLISSILKTKTHTKLIIMLK